VWYCRADNSRRPLHSYEDSLDLRLPNQHRTAFQTRSEKSSRWEYLVIWTTASGAEKERWNNVTARNRYALMAIFDLAKAYAGGETPLQLQQISENNHIPRGYLLQIMRLLGMAGILYSARGSKGGYTLARHPSEISIGDVMRAINGPHAWLAQPNMPPLPSPLDTAWESALQEMMEVLDRKTFADLIPPS